MCNVNSIIFGATILKKDEVEGKRVIEVGSYDVNGSLRPILESWKPIEYVGIDIEPGPGVDIICPAENIVTQFGEERFDLVVSSSSLEHIKDWRAAISNMKNVCKPNGIILIIVPSDWPYHSYPNDFWRYGKGDIENIFSDSDILILREDQEKPSLVYAKIRKPEEFKERDLSEYELYSVIVNKRIKDINNYNYNSIIKKMMIRDKIKTITLKLCSKFLSFFFR